MATNNVTRMIVDICMYVCMTCTPFDTFLHVYASNFRPGIYVIIQIFRKPKSVFVAVDLAFDFLRVETSFHRSFRNRKCMAEERKCSRRFAKTGSGREAAARVWSRY